MVKGLGIPYMENQKFNVLSLFDGMSCGQIALNRLGIIPTKYYASEIDKHAMMVTQANYPNTIQLGSVTEWQSWDIDWSSIDLVTGGFPCQAWSVAGKQLGDKDERGMLFWVMLDIMKKVREHNPKANFLIENVKMKGDFERYITYHTEQALGTVYKYLINSSLVSAQNRQRYYWTSIGGVTQPEDKNIVLNDVIDNPTINEDEKQRSIIVVGLADDLRGKDMLRRIYHPNGIGPTLDTMQGGNREPKVICGAWRGRYLVDGVRQDTKQLTAGLTTQRLEVRADEKTNTLTTVQKDNVLVFRDIARDYHNEGENVQYYRKLTPEECEKLQTVPVGYTNHVSKTHRYKMLGNGWTVDVIVHILSFLFDKDKQRSKKPNTLF